VARQKRTIVKFDELPLLALYRTADEGTDLECALMCGAYIENATGQLLEKVMIDHTRSDYLLNDDNGILSSSGARSSLCFCLGLIDKETYDNARRIAYIRNKFAHSHVPIGFDHKSIVDECNALQAFFVRDVTDKTSRRPKELSTDELKELFKNRRRKLVFCTAWTSLSIGIPWSANRKPTGPPLGRVWQNITDLSQPKASLFMIMPPIHQREASS
jgi:DNA-binding MltR family transcriptional regulator